MWFMGPSAVPRTAGRDRGNTVGIPRPAGRFSASVRPYRSLQTRLHPKTERLRPDRRDSYGAERPARLAF
jgi:hypothetical protein